MTTRPYLVAIDGLSGAGKSTLATTLQQQVADLTIVHKDDFYRVMKETERAKLNAEEGYHTYSDWERLRDQVLLPLRSMQAAKYQRYDWPTNQLADVQIAEPANIVVIEGVTTIRPELRNYYDLTIWVETSNEERNRRQIERAENSSSWIARWAAAEAYYRETVQPQLWANLTIAGE